MNFDSRIFVAGHLGLVGRALCRVLRARGFENLILVPRQEVDLTDPIAVQKLFSTYQPGYVFLSAARVGGIRANATFPVEFMADNMRIQMNVMEYSQKYNVKKLLFLGSACAYPKFSKTPIREEDLLTGTLEPSNECYALAKISGIRLCQAYQKEFGCNFISAMPTNLYGIGDHYDLENSHVIPGMIHRLHKAKGFDSVKLWGTGTPTREFLYADDLAEACLCLMERYTGFSHINIGSGKSYPLREIANLVAEAVDFGGDIEWDHSKPDGTPQRFLDSSRMFALGWSPRVSLNDGIALAYRDFLKC